MKNKKAIQSILAVALILPTILVGSSMAVAHGSEFTSSFMFKKCRGFSSTGRNPFFILKPGFQKLLVGKEDGVEVRLTITVLHQTQTIDGIQTRVVQEAETKGGQLVEISRNYFAICNRDNSVVYFGEDVDIYENGQIVSHDGAWRAGVRGAKPGIIMPGTVLLGARFFNEIAPGVALDRSEIISLSEVVQTPKKTFKNCLKVKETTPLEPGNAGFKFYAPGIGLIQDNVVKLVAVSTVDDDDDD
jgi:hypothetical protein